MPLAANTTRRATTSACSALVAAAFGFKPWLTGSPAFADSEEASTATWPRLVVPTLPDSWQASFSFHKPQGLVNYTTCFLLY